MNKTSKSEIEKIVKNCDAVCVALSLSTADAKLLKTVYTTARKFKDPIATLSTLCTYLSRARMNELEAHWDEVGRILELIETMPERAPRGSAASNDTADIIAFTPKKHAEFTFTPTAAFRGKSGSPHPDVGLFLDKGEHLVLEGAARSAKSDRTILKIKEGTVSFVTDEWRELSPSQMAKLTAAKTSDSTVFDRSRIVDEYLN